MKNIMVCVTKQKACQRLIEYGSQLRTSENDQLIVIHVAKGNTGILGSDKEGEALEYLYQKAKDAGAGLMVEKSDEVLETLIDIVETNHITDVIVGASGENAVSDGFLDRLAERLDGKAKLTVIPAVS